jgi:two-component system nitrate/nitrite sensor histidine kinase NarX
VHAEQLLRQEVEARQREQAALLDISRTLASSLELKPDLILDQLGQMVQYSRAALFVLEDSSLVAVAVRGVRGAETGMHFRIILDGADTLAQLFNEHRPIRIADISSDHPNARFLRSVLAKGGPTLIEGARAWMWVPLAAKDRLLGGIGIAQAQPSYFSAHHADLALTVAHQAAITMINAELHRNAQSLAVLEERQRLARNLHDAVNQSLFSAGLIAEVLPRLWDRDQLEARRSLEDLRKLTRGAMAEMRALLAELRPSTLTDADLGDLLRLLGNAFTGRTNVPATVTVEGEGALPPEVQVAAYRVCQEALSNVAKYAKARKVEISLKQYDAAIQLSIRDDGKGFDAKRTASGHYGLSMMQERADAIGARLSVTSRLGRGTDIALSWTASGKQDA